MSTFSKDTEAQSNVLDGTVFCYEPIPGEGVYATVAGRDGQVYIIAFDMTDLSHLHKAAESAFAPENRGASREDLTRITQSGMPFLMDIVENEPCRRNSTDSQSCAAGEGLVTVIRSRPQQWPKHFQPITWPVYSKPRSK